MSGRRPSSLEVDEVNLDTGSAWSVIVRGVLARDPAPNQLLLVLWALGDTLDISATAAAFVGVGILLVTKVLSWKDMADNPGW